MNEALLSVPTWTSRRRSNTGAKDDEEKYGVSEGISLPTAM